MLGSLEGSFRLCPVLRALLPLLCLLTALTTTASLCPLEVTDVLLSLQPLALVPNQHAVPSFLV